MFQAFEREVPADIENQTALLLDLYSNGLIKFIGIEVNHERAGIGGITIYNKVGSVGYMGVLPKYRNRGLGSQIFQQLVHHGQEVGCESFILFASKFGLPVYQKAGFKTLSVAVSLYQIDDVDIDESIDLTMVTEYKEVPKWINEQDTKAFKFDRNLFLWIKMKHGSKLIGVPSLGYALITGKRVGPIVAQSSEIAIKLLQAAKKLGGMNFIPFDTRGYFKSLIKDSITQVREENKNIMMIYGKKLDSFDPSLVAIGTFGKL